MPSVHAVCMHTHVRGVKALVPSFKKKTHTHLTLTFADCSLYCFAQENFAAYCISLWETQMCVLAASECLQLCMTLLLASLHWVQTEKLCLRAMLSALSLSLSVALFLCHCCLFSWSLSPLSPSVTAVYWLASLPPSHLVHFLSFFFVLTLYPHLIFSFFLFLLLCLSLPLLSSSPAWRDEVGLTTDR